MLVGPDWSKLYAEGNCLYYGVPFSDEQWKILDNAKSPAERDELLRKMREDYMKDRDLATGELKKPEVKEEVKEVASEKQETEEEKEESIEDVKPSKPTKKKGK